MPNSLVIPVIGGLGAGIAFLAVFAMFAPFAFQNDSACGESVNTVKANAPYTILLPRTLPAGYSLQSIESIPPNHSIILTNYFTRSLCDPNNPYSPEEGEIYMSQQPLSYVSNSESGEEYVQTEMAKYEAININATSYVFQDGRMHGIGYWDEAYLKARLMVVDEKTGTIVGINARSLDTPLEELAMIAESLKE